MSERRTDRFLDAARNHGLPPFLADDPGVDSGLMIAQYTAAGIVSELKRLAAPASVDSIPSSAMQEDHVSMGWAAARKLRRALDGLARVLADRDPHRGAGPRPAGAAAARPPATGAVLDAVRAPGVAGPGPDRHLAPEIEAVTDARPRRRRSSPPPSDRRRTADLTRPTAQTSRRMHHGSEPDPSAHRAARP